VYSTNDQLRYLDWRVVAGEFTFGPSPTCLLRDGVVILTE
jgi:hypothetical protein